MLDNYEKMNSAKQTWPEPSVSDVIVLLDSSLHIFDEFSDTESNVTILSDPFSIDYPAIYQQRPDYTEGDVFALHSFSDKFKSAIGCHESKVERGDTRTMMEEAPDQIRAKNVFNQVKKRVPLMAQIKIINLLNDKEVTFGEAQPDYEFIPDEKKTWEDLKDEVFGGRNILRNIRRLTEKERSRKLLKAQSELEAYETMSGYWRLISEYDDFVISPPGPPAFDAYQEPGGHWLQNDPVPIQVFENSQSKVLIWFSKYYQNSK